MKGEEKVRAEKRFRATEAIKKEKESIEEAVELDEGIVESEEEVPLESEILEDLHLEEIKANDDEPDNSAEEALLDLKHDNNKLLDENKKLSNELDVYKDRLIRTSSEYENFRKRSIKEKEGIYTDACEDVLKNILPVLDNLERAYLVEGSIEDFKKGIEITIRQFQASLEKLQVEEIPTDCGFDPNYHNAVMHINDESIDKNIIVDVFQKGYKRGSKILRHSMVKVAN